MLSSPSGEKLLKAPEYGNLDEIKSLIQASTDINYKSRYEMTALMFTTNRNKYSR